MPHAHEQRQQQLALPLGAAVTLSMPWATGAGALQPPASSLLAEHGTRAMDAAAAVARHAQGPHSGWCQAAALGSQSSRKHMQRQLAMANITNRPAASAGLSPPLAVPGSKPIPSAPSACATGSSSQPSTAAALAKRSHAAMGRGVETPGSLVSVAMATGTQQAMQQPQGGAGDLQALMEGLDDMDDFDF